jgi:hypothetical protein
VVQEYGENGRAVVALSAVGLQVVFSPLGLFKPAFNYTEVS